MSREQIEEIARVIQENSPLSEISSQDVGEALYNANFRKQEWISVDERLPDKWKKVLCFYPEKDYGSNAVIDYMETDDGHFAEQHQYGKPTHWMPLPEPPKMKGGDGHA